MKVGIISFTSMGKSIENKLQLEMESSGSCVFLYDKNKSTLSSFVEECFRKCHAVIFVSATGIAVRSIAPFIKSKSEDPAIIVVDDGAKHVISLLSGHLGGANELALKIAALLDSDPVITTSTDVNNKFAVDVWTKQNDFVIADVKQIKYISSDVVENIVVGFESDFGQDFSLPQGLRFTEFGEEKAVNAGICLSYDGKRKPFEHTLNAIPKKLTLGIGCRKNTDFDTFESFILDVLDRNSISILAIEKIRSIDLKKDEPCILKFAEKYNIDFKVYSAEELNDVQGDFTPSSFVSSVTGVDNVCERSAVKGACSGVLKVKKTGGNGVTVAIAEKEWKCKF